MYHGGFTEDFAPRRQQSVPSSVSRRFTEKRGLLCHISIARQILSARPFLLKQLDGMAYHAADRSLKERLLHITFRPTLLPGL